MSKLYKLGVIGNPIEHSMSPFIHSRFARYENISLEYLPYKINEPDFNKFVKEFFSDKNAKGLNVTLPYKKKAAEINGDISKEAKYINAVNTITNYKNKLSLASTDGIGFIDDINSKKFDLENKKILIIGAGAASESVLYKVTKSKVNAITIFNRTKEKSEKLQRKYGSFVPISLDVNSDCEFDLIINGSSAGLTGKFNPIDNLKFDPDAFFYDLNYSLTLTPFCKWAMTQSSNVHDGMGMLVYQAAHSFKIWFDLFPDTKKVIKDIEGIRE